MVDDDLLQVGFKGPVVKTRAKPPMRFAIATLCAERSKHNIGESDSDTVRWLLWEALAAVGWPVERCEIEYARYVLRCHETSQTNHFV